ncbi:lipoyl(octanoyl) transferase LipB [Thermoleptolyngbya sp. PKUAC-SCTB121]|uniref:lipoyl(octanoyl) transferase LipB n=1 Tax=Thermoleptolyngbya sp. PKUAC-SCTB121 TaxID=2811482 RepID=UPI001965DA25|nr:lipoyl(octanoyl) transferase LipB [Thermoleptolyngbya sp. PKUAC-SCTB121]
MSPLVEQRVNQPSSHICWLWEAGLVPYKTAWEWQRSHLNRLIRQPDSPDLLILLEHPPVYTLGQGATLDFVKFDLERTDAEIHRVERGGEVTYHGPGQLVGYPILNLRRYRQDLHWYLRQLEEVVIRAIAPFGLAGDRIDGLTGVWVGGRKVGAIGVKVSRWVTMHGFSLNVCPEMRGFGAIVPCGIGDRPVGCLADWIPEITVAEVQGAIAQSFAEVFEVTLQPYCITVNDL